MLCPKCQFDNADGMIFCGKCGTKLEIFCPQCNFGNPGGYDFCGKCGYKLSFPSETATEDLSFDDKLAKIQKYLPKGLSEKILSQRDRIEGERKQVTVMFCDMESFTHLSEKLSPEEIYAIMDRVYEILIHKVHDYEGTVNEMTGDGIMALFGAPVALEDAPQRAIRSSLAIHREMTKFSDQFRQERKDLPSVKMRIGIHTGPVVVGTVGNDLRVEFTRRLLGEIALKTNSNQAAPHFEESIAILREIKAENELALAFVGYGRLYKQQNQIIQAREYLMKALEIFERLGTLLEPDKVRGILAELPEN
jgi:tetratricopeptide (TPR) repeat protein